MVLTILSIILKFITVGVIQRQKDALIYVNSLLVSSVIMVALVHMDGIKYSKQVWGNKH